MTEAYVIQSTLNLAIDPTIAGIRSAIGAYKDLLTTMQSIRDMQDSINTNMGSASGAFAANMASAAASARATASSAQEIARLPPPEWMNLPPGGGGSRQGFSGQRDFVPPQFGPDASYRDPRDPVNLYDPMGNRPQRGDYYASGYGAQMLGNAAGGLVDGGFSAAAGVAQQKLLLKRMGVDPEAAYAAAVKTQQEVMGTFVGKNIDLIILLKGLTQDGTLSIAALPEMARAQQVFTSFGRNGEADVRAVMQSAEMRGILFKDGKPDMGAISKFLQNSETIAAMSGGRYGPVEVYQMLRSAGVSGSLMTDGNGLAEMLPLIQSIGAARAGTALRGFSQQFSAGKMSDYAVAQLEDLGLIKRNTADHEYHKAIGLGRQRLAPDAMPDGDLEMANRNPMGYVLSRLLPAVQAQLATQIGAKYVTGDEQTKLMYESARMQQISTQIPGGVFDSEMVRLAPLIARDVNAFQQQSQKGDAYNDTVKNNPLIQAQAVDAAKNAMMIQLGDANMAASIAVMKGLTEALNAMAGVFKADPHLGQELMYVADALKVLAPIVATLMVAAPALAALKRIWGYAVPAAEVAGAAGAAGPLGALAAAGAAAYGVNKLLDYAGLKEADLFNKLGWKNLAATTALESGMSPQDAANRYNVTVHNYIDGKLVATTAIKTIVDGANGPLSTSGDFDSRRGYQPTEH